MGRDGGTRMDCKTCDELLATCRSKLTLYSDAALHARGVVEHSVWFEQLERLRQDYRDANDALMRHWRGEHGLTPKSSHRV
jgi:hypothetical protein